MRRHVTINRYCLVVILAAAGSVAAVYGDINFRFVQEYPLDFALLFGGLTLGELLPVKIPRRGGDEAITLSTSFTFALLLLGGIGPALAAQVFASALQDLAARKPLNRVLFNVAQYSLSMVAAVEVIHLLHADGGTGTHRPFESGDLPAVLLGAGTFFIVNTGIVGVAVALYQRAPIGKHFRNDALFVFITGNVLLFLAPIVVAAVSYSPWVLPLFAAPILAIFNAGRQAVRSEHAAHHDSLTGLPNRTAFHDAVTHAMEEDHSACCVMLMDLDRFKEVNDTLGHRYGDMLLQQVAGRLSQHIGGEERIARLGGDEFAIFVPRCNREPAREFAQAVADSLRAPFELDQIVVDVQASVGIALAPGDGTDVETLLQKADVAMYRAKETHADVALYEEGYDHHSPAKLALTADLRAAIGRDEIVVWYQPILDLHSGEITAAEALVRWQHPDLGLLMPGSFIDMAEHTNLIKPLTARVLDLALRQVAEWNEQGLMLKVAVNVSARVLIERDFSKQVLSALERAGVQPGQLKLEVTESALMVDPFTARSVLRELDWLGVEISIDDFGTGYSSLAYLTDLPVSEVKIDRSFVARMTGDSREAIIVSSTIQLARHLGLRAVAEGVEELSLLERLKELRCDSAQGFGISRPMNAADATLWLEARRPVPEAEAIARVVRVA
jgi:diguanylate cyclase (GGDEF)-like protein